MKDPSRASNSRVASDSRAGDKAFSPDTFSYKAKIPLGPGCPQHQCSGSTGRSQSSGNLHQRIPDIQGSDIPFPPELRSTWTAAFQGSRDPGAALKCQPRAPRGPQWRLSWGRLPPLGAQRLQLARSSCPFCPQQPKMSRQARCWTREIRIRTGPGIFPNMQVNYLVCQIFIHRLQQKDPRLLGQRQGRFITHSKQMNRAASRPFPHTLIPAGPGAEGQMLPVRAVGCTVGP